jgi:hypothetical protein
LRYLDFYDVGVSHKELFNFHGKYVDIVSDDNVLEATHDLPIPALVQHELVPVGTVQEKEGLI